MGLEKVYPGDRSISANTINTLIDYYESVNLGGLGASGMPGQILVRNTTSSVLSFGAAVGISAPMFVAPQTDPGTGDDAAVVEIERFRHFSDRNYNAVMPTEGMTLGITLAPIAPDDVGPVVLSGVVRSVVDVKDTGHKTVTFTTGTTALESSDSGKFSFLINPTATGKQWCDLVFGVSGGGGGVPQIKNTFGVTQTTFLPGTVGLVRLYTREPNPVLSNDSVMAYLPPHYDGIIIQPSTPVVISPASYLANITGNNPVTTTIEWQIDNAVYPGAYQPMRTIMARRKRLTLSCSFRDGWPPVKS